MLTLVTLSTSLLQPFDGSSRVRASPDYASMASALAANVPLEAWSDALSQTPSYSPSRSRTQLARRPRACSARWCVRAASRTR